VANFVGKILFEELLDAGVVGGGFVYEKASKGGYEPAQLNLGLMYESGMGVPVSMEKAAHWYTQASIQGNATATAYLGDCYEKGNGVPKDLNQAIALYQQASTEGNEFARKQLKRLGLLPQPE
tara:strand:+ start:495 stop:863 length:369 start_codon:yes stop_codon:yes gene_type:complete